MECSAKSRQNLTQVFYAAQRTVAFPISPLFDRSSQSLTPAFVRVLRRVFRFFDRDQDGLWSFAELNLFQKTVYLTELSRQEVVLLHSVLREQDPASIRADGLTEDGFCLLLRLFLQRDRTEAAWLLLRSLRFDAQLRPPPAPAPAQPGPAPAVPEWSFPVSLFLTRVGPGSTFPLDCGAVRFGRRRVAGPRGFGAPVRPATPRNGALEIGGSGGESGECGKRGAFK